MNVRTNSTKHTDSTYMYRTRNKTFKTNLRNGIHRVQSSKTRTAHAERSQTISRQLRLQLLLLLLLVLLLVLQARWRRRYRSVHGARGAGCAGGRQVSTRSSGGADAVVASASRGRNYSGTDAGLVAAVFGEPRG